MDNARQDPDAAMFESDELVEPPRWPKVVGIISIVWGGLGLACGGCGLLSSAFMGSMMKGAEQTMGGPMPDVMKPSNAQMAINFVGLIPAGLLVAAGIMLVARKRASVSLHMVYAVLSIILTAIGTVFAIQQQMALAEWVKQNPDNKWAQQANPTIGIAVTGFFLLLGIAWPVFCLIWFGAVKRRAPLDIPRDELV